MVRDRLKYVDWHANTPHGGESTVEPDDVDVSRVANVATVRPTRPSEAGTFTTVDVVAGDMQIVSVAAVAENGVIGQGDSLPWHLPHESRRYRERVADDVVALGRHTFELFDDLPGRAQVVLSRSDRDWPQDTAHHASDVEDAVGVADSLDADVLYVLGGSAIYELFLDVADRQLLSRVHGEYDGDAYYPAFDEGDWELVEATEHDGYTLEDWRRRT